MDQQFILDTQHKEDEELIAVVDEHNNVVGSANRARMRKEVLPHRATYIFLIQSETNKLFIHKRTSIKRYCPGYWDPCFGGVVKYGESYVENAGREIEEESGVKVIHMEPLFEFYYEGIKCWGQAFRGYFDGLASDLKPQLEEVEIVQASSYEEIDKMIQDGSKFTPDGLLALNKLKEMEV